MNVIEKYGRTGNLEYILKMKIREMILKITDKEINAYTSMLCNEIRGLGIGEKVGNTFKDNYSFDCNGKLEDYIISGATEIVNYAKTIHLRQIALFCLMNVGVLMPVGIQTNNKIQLDLNHSHGNNLFDLFMDLLPYNQFLIVQLPAEDINA